jgi:serine/threonine protein phosphatase PrpC
MSRLHLDHSLQSVPGDKRRGNEDAATYRAYRDGTVLAAIADGVGSAKVGGEAARRAVEMLADCFAARTAAWSPRRALEEFIARINAQLLRESQARFAEPELVTTLASAVVADARAYLATLGDSPIYLFRAGRLTLLNTLHQDNTLEGRGALTQALGLQANATPCFVEVDLQVGDQLLLCSDGVAVPLGERILAEMLARSASAGRLVIAAREPDRPANQDRPYPDDATALLLEVTGREDAAAPGQKLEIMPTLRAGDMFPDGALVRPLDATQRVWLAQPTAPSAAPVVLKFPAADAAGDDTRTEGFLREAWQAARIDFPGFVRSRVPTAPALRYYVQEYVEAPTLRAVLKTGPLSVEHTVALARFLTEAAQALTRLDLAHADIKPDNILVIRSPERGGPLDFRLIDLGVAASLYTIAPRAGTASYLAPERFGEAPISERTELYAIGATLYECLTRKLPHGEIERFQTPAFATPPKSPSTHNPIVPDWLDALVLRALALKPEERYAHYSELAHDLAFPHAIKPFVPADRPWIERAPLTFFKVLCALLALLNLLQLWWHLRHK